MSKHLFKGALCLMLAALLAVSALPVSARAAQAESTDLTNLTKLTEDHVTLDKTVFVYTGEEVKPHVTVQVDQTLLTPDAHYTLEYADNIAVGTATVTVKGVETAGYMGTIQRTFTIEEAVTGPTDPVITLIPLKGTDVAIEGTSFPYTGEEIKPAVTVTVNGKVLTNGTDYAVEYINNLLPGTGTVIVRGIATAAETYGYTGEVRVDFTIQPIPEQPDEQPEEKPEEKPEETPEEYPMVEIKSEHVRLEGTKFYYTGKAIEPKVTVKIGDKVLTAGQDYRVSYENNVAIGTATVTIIGKGTATETGGYSGTVKLNFSIVPNYQITKGSGAKWYRESSKSLSFTVSGDYADFTGVSVDGKRLDTSYYAVQGSTLVTLKNSFLKKLSLGEHTITIHYHDGDAAGTFRVSEGLDPSNPETADTFPLQMLSAVMALSLMGLAAAAWAWKKQLWK